MCITRQLPLVLSGLDPRLDLVWLALQTLAKRLALQTLATCVLPRLIPEVASFDTHLACIICVIAFMIWMTIIIIGTLSKRHRTFQAPSTSNVSGLSSSVAFTPVKGIELHNPELAAQRVKAANERYFAGGFLNLKSRKDDTSR
jgi:hypothetical protein